jgi:hypothetical protein
MGRIAGSGLAPHIVWWERSLRRAQGCRAPRRLALAACLAVLPTTVVAQEMVYLECEKTWREGSDELSQTLILRLSINRNEITQMRWWAGSGRRWYPDSTSCGSERGSYDRGFCSVEPGAYVYSSTVGARRDVGYQHRIRIDRNTGAYSETYLNYDDGERVDYSGTCRRTENPELTPAPEPIL